MTEPKRICLIVGNLAKRSGGNDFGTTFALTAATGVPGGTVAIDRTSVPLGGDGLAWGTQYHVRAVLVSQARSNEWKRP